MTSQLAARIALLALLTLSVLTITYVFLAHAGSAW